MRLRLVLCSIWLLWVFPAQAGDRCHAGPKHAWKSKTALEQRLIAQGWKVRRIRVDDGCYEALGWDMHGEEIEAKFHPLTLKEVDHE